MRIWRIFFFTVFDFLFSPFLGDAFAAAATEGVFVYSLEKAGLGSSLLGGVSNWLFDAVTVDEDTTPSNARLQLSQGNLSAALDIVLRLNMHDLIEEIIEAIPHCLSKLAIPLIWYLNKIRSTHLLKRDRGVAKDFSRAMFIWLLVISIICYVLMWFEPMLFDLTVAYDIGT